MTLFSRYLLRAAAGPFLIAFSLALGALMLERLLRLMDTLLGDSASFPGLLQLLVLLLPHYIGLALPLGLFVGLLMGLQRLHQNSEITALMASGQSPWNLTRPILIVCAGLVLLSAINAAWLQPHARYAYRAVKHELEVSGQLAVIQAGKFHSVGEGRVLRADRVSDGGRTLEGLFARWVTADGQRMVLTAPQARRLGGQGDLTLRLYGGEILYIDPAGGRINSIGFDQYDWSPRDMTPTGYGAARPLRVGTTHERSS